MSIYDFTVKDASQNEIPLRTYEGKVLLIVNTATACGLTPQYEGLEHLYQKYQSQGFEILDFPCNQFLGQAPGSEQEIVTFCQTKYNVTFKTFAKINVNGDDAAPLYTYLKNTVPTDIEDTQTPAFLKKLKDLGQAVIGTNIKWNFTKFLVDQNGKVVARFAPNVKPEDISEKIEALLHK